MKIDSQEVMHVAKLARLNVSDRDAERLTSEMNSILAYMDKLNELDTSGIEPMAHALQLDTPFREDTVKPSLSNDNALENAPQKEGGFFVVPRVL